MHAYLILMISLITWLYDGGGDHVDEVKLKKIKKAESNFEKIRP